MFLVLLASSGVLYSWSGPFSGAELWLSLMFVMSGSIDPFRVPTAPTPVEAGAISKGLELVDCLRLVKIGLFVAA